MKKQKKFAIVILKKTRKLWQILENVRNFVRVRKNVRKIWQQ